MNKKLSTIRRISLSLIALALVVPAQAVFAQTPTAQPGNSQALEIGPPLVNLKGDPGQTLRAQISLRDIANNKLVVSNEINDFSANGEDGTPKLLIDQKTANPNSIVPWITPLPQFTLVPKQIQKLDLILKVPKDAPPGGYYGVIRFSGTPPGLESSGVSLSASVGALVFVRVNGQAHEEIGIQSFSTLGDNGKPNWLFESIPVNLSATIKNSGNLFEAPKGIADIKDMFGNLVGSVNFNQLEGNVLPNSSRRFNQPFDKSVVGDRFMFGKYTATLTMTYGDNHQTVTSTVTFWIIPYRLVAAIIIGLIALGLLIRFYLQRYRERILGNSRGSGRRR